MTSPVDCPRFSKAVHWLWIGVFVFVVGKAVIAPAKRSCYPGYAQGAREWITDGPFQSMSPFQYLPYFSDLLAPFAACPERIGACCWAVMLLVTYATGLRAFVNHFPVTQSPNPACREVVFLSGLLIGSGSLANHQANVLIIGCWLWGAVAVHKGRWWTAALLFALPGFKIYTWTAGLVLASLYPRKLAGRFAIVVLGLLGLPFLFHPAAAVTYRFETMTTYLTSGEHYRIFPFQTLYEAWRQYLGPVSASFLLPIQAVMGACIPIALLILRRRGVAESSLVRHGLFLVCVWCVSFGPSIELPTYLLAAPVLGWMIARCVYGEKPAKGLAAVLIVMALTAGSPFVASWPAASRWAMATKAGFLSMAGLYVGLLTTGSFALLRKRTNSAETSTHSPISPLRAA